MSQVQPTPDLAFANSLGEATTRLNDAVDATLDSVRDAGPAQAAAIAQRALDSLRSAKTNFDADFASSLVRLDQAASGSHEPVPH
ncbi:MAG TPA: hypothetical protein VEJ84_15975 [Acidimicrobiales bacterium]|nr:hypothetical protein [Acidimicrobiales bacterium]